jgi:uncharacterized protein YegP (UPF0339 family)
MRPAMKTSLLASFLLATAATFATACATVADEPGDATTSNEVTVRPTVDLWAESGRHQFDLLAATGEPLLHSQSYSSRTMALNGLLSVLDNGGYPSLYRITTTADGAYFDLLAANRAVIASSEVYADATAAQAGVDATIQSIGAYLEYWDGATGKRFEIFEGADRRFYFNLHAGNGEIVLSSQGYDLEASALNGTFSVADNGVLKARYLVKQASDGRWYFNLTSSNGQVIASSQLYSTKYNAERGRDAIIAMLPNVELI